MAYFLRFPGQEIKLPPGESVIGRDRWCTICIDDQSVSRRHVRLLCIQDSLTVEDLGSKNGIKVNGARVSGVTRLGDGDVLTIGGRECSVRKSGAFDTFTGAPPEPYRAPTFRTCIACRTLCQAQDPCPKCGSESLAPDDEPTREHWVDPDGRRNTQRTLVRFRAVYMSANMTIDGEVSDLSTGGAFFTAPLDDATGTACDVIIYHQPGKPPLQIDAEVVRVSAKPRGLGLRFVRLTRSVQRWLLSLSEQDGPG